MSSARLRCLQVQLSLLVASLIPYLLPVREEGCAREALNLSLQPNDVKVRHEVTREGRLDSETGVDTLRPPLRRISTSMGQQYHYPAHEFVYESPGKQQG